MKKNSGEPLIFRLYLRDTIHRRIFILLSAILIPILLIQVLLYYQRFKLHKQAVFESNLEIARGIAVSFREFVESVLAQQLAIGIALTSEVPLSESRIQLLLSESARDYPSVRMFVWMTREGKVVYSSSPGLKGMILLDSVYFHRLIAGRAWGVTDFYYAPDNNEPAVSIYRGIWDGSGKLLGVVAAVLEPYRFETIFPIMHTAARAYLIVDKSGQCVYREPEAVDWNGKDRHILSIYPDLRRTLEGWEITGTVGKALDGIPRVFAFTPISMIGWVAGSTISIDAAFDPIYSQLGMNALLFSFAILLATGLAIHASLSITRPLKRLQDHAMALGRRETESPIQPEGPEEFRILAHTLNNMADSLRMRAERAESEHRNLQAAEEEIRITNEQLESKVHERTVQFTVANEELKARIEDHDRTLAMLRDSEKRLKEYTSKLELINRELRDFTFTASHDLQEPLRKIELFADLISKRLRDGMDDKSRDYLDRMVGSTRRVRLLVKALLSYSRITEKEQAYRLVNLNRIATQITFHLEDRITEAGARIELGDLPPIEADPERMFDLFLHLIDNALTYRRDEDPLIHIYGSLLSDGDSAQIFVQDNGIGFDEKYLDRIFRPFQRLHGREEYDVAGIGLAICRKILALHGGTITARSTPGVGSIFIITLPLKQRTIDT